MHYHSLSTYIVLAKSIEAISYFHKKNIFHSLQYTESIFCNFSISTCLLVCLSWTYHALVTWSVLPVSHFFMLIQLIFQLILVFRSVSSTKYPAKQKSSCKATLQVSYYILVFLSSKEWNIRIYWSKGPLHCIDKN